MRAGGRAGLEDGKAASPRVGPRDSRTAQRALGGGRVFSVWMALKERRGCPRRPRGLRATGHASPGDLERTGPGPNPGPQLEAERIHGGLGSKAKETDPPQVVEQQLVRQNVLETEEKAPSGSGDVAVLAPFVSVRFPRHRRQAGCGWNRTMGSGR